MAASHESVNIAMFCDFENVALGVRDAKFDKFDIGPVLERLLLKGSIVVKKAYCDWERYKGFKAAMHEASFELIEIPHVRQSGKNSADIRMVVDALDLCYTKEHVDTFVIVSGDSDFSPLVSKLRENAKHVIGVGIKQSTSDLLIANCDEFIFYDDLVRENPRSGTRRDARTAPTLPRLSSEELEARKTEAIDLAVATFEALAVERGENGKIWSSMLKEAMKRRKPDFNESYFGFRSFGNLLEEAQARGLLEIGRDEKSGIFVSRCAIQTLAIEPPVGRLEEPGEQPEPDASAAPQGGGRGRNRGKRGGKNSRKTEIEPQKDTDPIANRDFPPESSTSAEDKIGLRSFGDSLEEAHTKGLLEPTGTGSWASLFTRGVVEPETPREGQSGKPADPDPAVKADAAPPTKPPRSRKPRKPKAVSAADPAETAAKAKED
ncbi:MAG: NYN domain-containing protein [Candidatus Accumulibacter sp.]|jgi:uncharacterized protein (TIGR00288 family)|nr:NYN domain-containing protein [Accumulibacter sp.]